MSYSSPHVFDALPSPRDTRDYRMLTVNPALIPPVIDLPDVPILNQMAQGACVGHGCAGAREVLEVIANGAAPVVPLSRAFIYYEARLMEGTQNQDGGAFVRDGCKVMNAIGVCTEDLFPYNPGNFTTVPPDLDITEAAQYKISSYARLNSSEEVRAALANKQPVVIGISVFESFERSVGSDGIVPLPGTNDQELGGHCMFVKGCHPDPRNIGTYLFRTQNSWGPDWADHGNCWIPQGYLNNPNLCSDMWAISL